MGNIQRRINGANGAEGRVDMSIKPHGDKFVPTCDFCGAKLESELTEYAAELALEHAGWRTKKEGGEFKDYCPKCQERMKK